ncbi:RcnB family protein [Dyella humi]|uniref:RcnB family protein n=1 Tax=Dyella humi TaxID=1770547 RepID=A0ABW8IMD8_9GAMM
MKRHLLALALLSSLPLVMTTTAAVAQDQDHDHDHGWQDDHGHDHDHGHDRDDHGRYDDRHDHGRHEGWDRHYGRGEYLPERYRGREYYIDDYARYHLYAPRPDQRWIRGDDGQFVLVAVATGLIVSEMVGH